MFRFVILSAFLATAFAAENVATRCFNNAGDLPVGFQIEGCSSAPCLLPQLEDAVINVKFNARRNSETLRTQLIVYFFANLGISMDTGLSSQACSGLVNSSCPVKEGEALDYTLKLPIESVFPVGTAVTIELSVVDDTNSPAFCARVPVRITESRNLNQDSIQVVN